MMGARAAGLKRMLVRINGDRHFAIGRRAAQAAQGLPDPPSTVAIFPRESAAEPEVLTPKTALFNGKDTAGWISHLKDSATAKDGQVCDKESVTILVNGQEVNKASGANLNGGIIGLQSERGAFEIRQETARRSRLLMTS